jgi:hypothetical protein
MSATFAGARVGNWYLEEQIARGARGPVYRARHFQEEGRIAAVKIFDNAAGLDATRRQQLPGEMLPLQRLEHANIARYFESGVSGPLVYVACEWVMGEDYLQRLRSGPLPWEEVLQVAVQVARALKHAHNRNVLHRELKPAHLMRDHNGIVKVLFCGFAKVLPPPPPPIPSPLGAEAFLPPELASGKPYSRRSDFYALGGVLYALLTGRAPFSANTLVELAHKHCYALPERPGLIVPHMPPELDEFICWLLEKNPTRRPSNALQVLEELERIRARLERQGRQLCWPAKLTPDTVETVALAQNPETNPHENTTNPRPLMQRAWVVVPAFLLVVGLLLYAFFRPQSSAEELYQAAQPLMQSEHPEDWERAWDEYLEPLQRRYPDQYVEQLAAFRRKLQEYRELRRALIQAHNWKPASEAERAYWLGVRLVQARDVTAARRIWQALICVFEGQPAEELWVKLAQHGLSLVNQQEALTASSLPSPAAALAQLEPVLQRLRELRATGQSAQAEQLRRNLEELYRYDPAMLEALRHTLPD